MMREEGERERRTEQEQPAIAEGGSDSGDGIDQIDSDESAGSIWWLNQGGNCCSNK